MNNTFTYLYNHCQLRAKERYNHSLTRGEFEMISTNIRKFKRPGLDIMMFSDIDSKENQHWIVGLKNKWFYVIYDMFAGFCITFMPIEALHDKQLQIAKGTRELLKKRGIWPNIK